ncbi:MAG: Flp pilus assembly protein CpaB [Telluria sp.]
MKNKRGVGMMALAIVLGLVAVALAARWLAGHPGKQGKQIVVTSTEISLGQRITPEMVHLMEWPAANVPRGAFSDPARLAGRVARMTMQRDDPLTEAKLAPAGTMGGLSALITEGRRAITVRVNDVVGVAGFALPGNYVDVLVHTQQDAGDRAHASDISKIVLERILVLAVAQEVSRDETKPHVVNAVTLEVTPAQAEALDLARSVGTLSLVLRNQVDPAPAATAGATKASLLAEADVPAPPVRAPAPAPAPAPRAAPRREPAHAAAPAPAAEPRDCIGVINGVHSSKECFQ